jgi:hypothetical protein
LFQHLRKYHRNPALLCYFLHPSPEISNR